MKLAHNGALSFDEFSEVRRGALKALRQPVEILTWTRGKPGECSAAIRERVVAAREIQLARFRDGKTSRQTNVELSWDGLKSAGALGKDCLRLIEAAAR